MKQIAEKSLLNTKVVKNDQKIDSEDVTHWVVVIKNSAIKKCLDDSLASLFASVFYHHLRRRNLFVTPPMKIKKTKTRRRVKYFFRFFYLFSLSLLHFLATLNTTSSSSPRTTPSQKVPARQETTNSGSEAKASTIQQQPMLTKVSVETKQSKYTKHQKQIWKKKQ